MSIDRLIWTPTKPRNIVGSDSEAAHAKAQESLRARHRSLARSLWHSGQVHGRETAVMHARMAGLTIEQVLSTDG